MSESIVLPFELDEDITEITDSEQLCPGVFYVVGPRVEDSVPVEYYAVERATAPLSEAAKSYGRPSETDPDIMLYQLDDPAGGRTVIKYEVQKYLALAHLPMLSDEDPHAIAVYGMEHQPEYFGDYPAPFLTPRGATNRYQCLARGVFVLETETFERMIAVCYPVWATELGEYTISKGEKLDRDKLKDIDKTLGYLFFPESAGCLALFELWESCDELQQSPIVKRAELMNAIYINHPEYALIFNRNEQEGVNDVGAHVWRLFGFDVELEGKEENLIRLQPGIGTDYLVF